MGVADWWVPKAALDAGEASQATWMANYTATVWTTVGGKLELTDRRLIFRPGVFDRALGDKVFSLPLDAITELGRKARTWNPFDGGLRTRLQITTRDGGVHLFVVNKLETVLSTIEGARKPR
jgi:hypothetical protein